jgi:hypothetical protein
LFGWVGIGVGVLGEERELLNKARIVGGFLSQLFFKEDPGRDGEPKPELIFPKPENETLFLFFPRGTPE